MGQRRQLAKLTPPSLPTLVQRPRLFKLLDRARRHKVVWVNAIPGSGKTSLVASYLRARRQRHLWVQLDEGDSDPATFFHYLRVAAEAASPRARTALENLTPEYLPGSTAFAHRFFAALHERLAPRTTIVFDNYQTLHADSPVHELVRIATTHLPRGAALFVISRSAPPPAFTRIRAEQQLATIGERVLRISVAETQSLLRLRARRNDRTDLGAAAKRLHAATGGWLAGTILLLMQTGDGAERLPSTSTREVLFDYFATEVLNELDPVSRKVLLATAHLPAMTAAMAQTLSGEPSAARILAGLHRGGYFTERHPDGATRYQYHPLFRQFLLSHALAHSTEEERFGLAKQSRSAARARRASRSRHVAMDGDAAFCGRGRAPPDPSAVADMARDARTASSSGSKPFHRPRAMRAPWLWYWLGAGYLTVRPTAARPLFERALLAFEASADGLGTLLSCAAVVESIIYAWRDVLQLDPWVDRLMGLADNAGDQLPPPIASAVTCAVFYGLFWRRPGHARFAEWSGKVERIIESAPELDMRVASTGVALVNASVNAGDIGRAERLLARVDDVLRRGDVSPFARLAGFQMRAVVAFTLGEGEKSRQAATQGLAFAAESGVGFWTVPLLGARCLTALALGDVAEAQRDVAQLLAISHDGVMVFRTWILTMQSWVEHERGNVRAAHRAAEAALQLSLNEGPFPETLARFSIAQTAHALGRPEKRPSTLHDSRRSRATRAAR